MREAGAVGVDDIVRMLLMPLADLEKSIGFMLGEKCFLITPQCYSDRIAR